MREWISPALASPDLMLVAQPPTQPRCRVAVERTVGTTDGSYTKVVPSTEQRAVQLAHQLRGLLPTRLQIGQRMNLFDHVLDAFLRRPQSD